MAFKAAYSTPPELMHPHHSRKGRNYGKVDWMDLKLSTLVSVLSILPRKKQHRDKSCDSSLVNMPEKVALTEPNWQFWSILLSNSAIKFVWRNKLTNVESVLDCFLHSHTHYLQPSWHCSLKAETHGWKSERKRKRLLCCENEKKSYHSKNIHISRMIKQKGIFILAVVSIQYQREVPTKHFLGVYMEYYWKMNAASWTVSWGYVHKQIKRESVENLFRNIYSPIKPMKICCWLFKQINKQTEKV